MNPFDADDLQEAITLCTQLPQFAPVADAVIEGTLPLVRKLGPVLNEFGDWLVDRNIRSIQRYEAAGLTREEAIYLTTCDRVALVEHWKSVKWNRKTATHEVPA